MTSSMVDRATSNMLIGPDWAMNTEICEMLNRDLGQAKDVVKALKRRLKSKNPKSQLLALTLLETVIKNCGDIVHMQVAERGILRYMVKMVKKRPDFQVKEKILVLIDTWQEAFGGPRARYTEYYAAYQELLHAGAVFPRRPATPAAPVLATSHGRSPFDPDHHEQQSPESSAPVLSLEEIQNARGIMDVVSEMLNALDPTNKEALKEDLIASLVEQCRSYKRRVYNLVNTTLDEELLSLGLALNDDLQRVLAEHDAIAAGIAVRQEKPKSPPALLDIGEAVDSKASATSTGANASSSATTTAVDPFEQLALTAEPHSDEKTGSVNAPPKASSHMDLLSWDDVGESTVSDNLSLVPIGGPPTTSTADPNLLALTVVDGGHSTSDNNNNTNSINSFDYSSNPGTQVYSSANGIQMPPTELHYSNGGVSSSMTPGNGYSVTQGFNTQHQSLTSGMNGHSEEAFPLPPWETQSIQETQFIATQPQSIQETQFIATQPQSIQATQTSEVYSQMMPPNHQPFPTQDGHVPGMYQYPMQDGQVTGMHFQPVVQGGQLAPAMQWQPGMVGQTVGMQLQPTMQGGQTVGMQLQQTMQGGQMAGMHLQPTMQDGQMAGMHLQPAMQGGLMGGGYAYAQQPGVHQYYNQMRPGYPGAGPNDLTQRMMNMSMGMNTNANYQMPSSSSSFVQNQQPMKPTRPVDNLFGDLVSIAKTKPNK